MELDRRALLIGVGGAAAASGPAANSNGSFHVSCTFSHRLKDDPIVFPRGPGQSHMHDFFGSRSTNASSSNASIKKSDTSCIRTNTRASKTDRSAYWVPALYVGKKVVNATRSMPSLLSKTTRRLKNP